MHKINFITVDACDLSCKMAKCGDCLETAIVLCNSSSYEEKF